MNLEEKISKLQEEYDKLNAELNNLKEQFIIAKQQYDYNNSEYIKLCDEIDEIIDRIDEKRRCFRINKNAYIESKEKKFLTKMTLFNALLLFIVTLIPNINNPYFNSVSLGLILGSPFLGASVSLAFYTLFKDKYELKLANEYEKTNEYQEFQAELEKEFELKNQKREERKKVAANGVTTQNNYLNLKNSIALKEQEIEKFKRKSFEILVLGKEVEEVKLEDTIPYCDESEHKDIPLIKKRIPNNKRK